MDIVRPAGWITKVGWGPQPFNHSLDQFVQENIRLQGSFSHNWPIWERVIQLLCTSPNAAPLGTMQSELGQFKGSMILDTAPTRQPCGIPLAASAQLRSRRN